ncbi:carbohydrate deacetylase [Aquimarina mytili]|uniref:ChbG/HpnK family deacetylase n=1 Tax=Aquimarina mytili TaxID=874423 RepID=A0A936ZTU2_9FLAO|nr:ChbG/HpnK family deacetylase [Aquimarina mytili]MBL0684172.1 ChbG/HpnK family deacetylase [Aquimarina mytili]
MKKIYVHADDFGIGNEITDNILDCIHNGVINSTSIVCNTEFFSYGIDKYKSISEKVRICLHLNLVEGTPLTPKQDADLIIDETGEFKYSFLMLWLTYSLSSGDRKAKFREQIKREIEYQVIKYQNAIGNQTPLRVDSHMHFHMIPFVFECLLEVSEKHNITFIRNPYELKYSYGYARMKNHISLNFIKNILLNRLSKKYITKAKKKGIQTNEYFVGVLSTGRMTYKDVSSALSRVKSKKSPDSVDILFHPGGVKDKGSVLWTNKNAFKTYYSSYERDMESEVLRSNELKNLIDDYENIFNN